MKIAHIILALLALSAISCGKKVKEDDFSSGINKSESFNNSQWELKKAVEANDLKATNNLLKKYPELDLNQIYEDGNTLLHLSIRNDFLEIRDLLIASGADIEMANLNGRTPLMSAAKYGRIDSLKLLLSKNVNPNLKDSQGNTALHLAILHGFAAIALELIHQGVDIHARNYESKTPLLVALDTGLLEVRSTLEKLVAISPGTPDIPTYKAILEQGKMKTLNELLKVYPQLVRDYESVNPLVIVIDIGNEYVAKVMTDILLSRGAHVDGIRNAGTTPLIEAVKRERVNFVDIYLQEKANINLLDKFGNSALVYAIEKNNLPIVRLLMKHNANKNYEYLKDENKESFRACAHARKTKADREIMKELRCFWPF
jgi:uncharacterized protein